MLELLSALYVAHLGTTGKINAGKVNLIHMRSSIVTL